MNRIVINKKWCKQCGICFEICPKNVFDWKDEEFPDPIRMEDCIGCMQCEAKCPDFAITVEKENKNG